jgi:holliday junction DNA helicase RuvA
MIARIKGTLIHKSTTHIVVDTQGVGYRLFVPLTTFYELPELGSTVILYVHTQVKQDGISLFGFHSVVERDVFQLMITVSGVGPKLALNILSGVSAGELIDAISCGNLHRLVGIPGIGKKTAERIVLELKDKIVKLAVDDRDTRGGDKLTPVELLKDDALSALVNLGYKSHVAKEALEKVIRMAPAKLTLDLLLKDGLKILSR